MTDSLANLQSDAVHDLAQPLAHHSIVFSDAYDKVTSVSAAGVKSGADKEVAQNGSLNLDQTGLYTRVGEALGSAAGARVGEALGGAAGAIAGGIDGAWAGAEKMMAQSTERQQVLAKVGPIPAVERPSLDGSEKNTSTDPSKKFDDDYASSLAQLKELPKTYTAGPGQDLQDIAKKIVDARAPITGETLSADTYTAEYKSLSALNPGMQIKDGTQITVYKDADLEQLAEKTEFKYVPQIGQFLKENGVTDQQIDQALKVQKAEPTGQQKLLGQILTDEGLATKQQVDAAFANQNQLKTELASVRKDAGF
jgi:hypothetical protein